MFSQKDTAQARHYSYSLLGRLYLQGITAELLPYVKAIPELAATLPLSFNADEAAAEHYHLLTFTLFPYESIFLDQAGLVGGRVSQTLLNAYGRAGYGESNAEPDHIGCELGFLAFVCAADAEARERGETAVATQLREIQQTFLQQHLLRWVVPLAIAIRRQVQPFYAALVELTLALLNDHYADLTSNSRDDISNFVLPEYSSLLDDPTTRLRDVTHYLLTPPYSGLFLSREVIGQIGRQLNLPVGFGGREDLLTVLLHTGGQYGLTSDCLSTLHKIANLWQADYTAALTELPTLTPFIVPWKKRVMETAAALLQLSSQLEKLPEFRA